MVQNIKIPQDLTTEVINYFSENAAFPAAVPPKVIQLTPNNNATDPRPNIYTAAGSQPINDDGTQTPPIFQQLPAAIDENNPASANDQPAKSNKKFIGIALLVIAGIAIFSGSSNNQNNS